MFWQTVLFFIWKCFCFAKDMFFEAKLLFYCIWLCHYEDRGIWVLKKGSFMKKLLATFVACILFCGSMAKALYKTRIYVINKTKDTFVRGEVKGEKGEKIAPAFKTRRGKGTYKKVQLEGYTCNGIPRPKWKCTANKRLVIKDSVDKETVSEDRLKIEPGMTVKIAEIDRDQLSAKLLDWSNMFPEYPNPDTERFKATKVSPVYPYEQLTTSLKGSDGSIDLTIVSERIGLSTMFSRSIASGSIGGGALAGGVWAVTSMIGGGVAIGTAAQFVGAGLFVLMGSAVVAGLSALASVGVITGLAQKSGLVVLPFVDGNYKVSYESKLRIGNIYKDVYISLIPLAASE